MQADVVRRRSGRNILRRADRASTTQRPREGEAVFALEAIRDSRRNSSARVLGDYDPLEGRGLPQE
jgi:hypothetical protein